MKYVYILLLALSFIACTTTSEDANDNTITVSNTQEDQSETMSKSIYDYSFTTIEGEVVPLSTFKGKKMLLVNTASECGYTPQYAQLQEVYEQMGDKVQVIGFPCNQFGGQEPGTDQEIAQFCEKNYGVDFLLSNKVDVKGDKAHPIWLWLTTEELNGKENSEVKWNFQKYLISENGNLLSIFYSATTPSSSDLKGAINQVTE